MLWSKERIIYDLSESPELEMRPETEDPGMEDWNPEQDPITLEDPPDEDSTEYRDSTTGEVLPSNLVREACKEEVEFMDSWEVGELRPLSEARQVTGRKPISGKWVYRNKRDRRNPLIRCRYVAREVSLKKDDSLFAATPPLEALRGLLSWAATLTKEDVEHGRTRPDKKILLIDVKKAHLHAAAVRDVYVELPPELKEKYPGKCWKLRKCLYGTKHAPARWEAHYTEKLEGLGFIRGKASSCCFMHPDREIRCVVLGDDFTFVGKDANLSWVEKHMSKTFLCKVEGRIGPDTGDLKQAQILNRVVTWTDNGLEYEADIRHGELLVRDLEVQGKDSVVTPGTKIRAEVPEGNGGKLLDAERVTKYRALAARANYLALDRPDLSFAAKECCRRMVEPREVDWSALRRVARYLRKSPRLVYEYPWQAESGLTVFVDSDFAGCNQTRKSTSGDCVMSGRHLLKHWSSTQKTLALSSGEAELSGVLKGASEGLGVQSVLRDLWLRRDLRIMTDASAALGICRRHGLGKVRHLAVGQLWAQEQLRSGAFKLYKHPGDQNPADMLTKHVTADLIQRHTAGSGMGTRDGRPTISPTPS